MIENGEIINLKGKFAEVEVKSNADCHKCNACISVAPDKRMVTAINKVNAKIGDKVKVYIHENKIQAGFLLYILPLIVFFTGVILANQVFKVKSEPLSALIGFIAMIFTYLIIKIISGTSSIKNYIK